MNYKFKMCGRRTFLRNALWVFSFFLVSTVQAVAYYKITDLSVKFPIQNNGGGFTPIDLSNTGLVLGYEIVPATQTSPAKFVYKLYNSRTGKLSPQLTANGKLFAGQAINGNGQIAGATSSGRVIRNPDGTATPIKGSIPYPNVAGPVALNDKGYMVLEGRNLLQLNMNNCTVYPYKVYTSNFSQTGFVPLPSFEGTNGIIRANDINNSRQIIGKSTVNMASQQCQGLPVISHAYVSLPSVNGRIVDLHRTTWPNLIGMGSEANSINDNGLAVGSYTYKLGEISRSAPAGTAYNRAVVWNTKNGSAKLLGDLKTPRKSATLNDININNVVVGKELTYSGLLQYNWYETVEPNSERAVVGDVSRGLTDLNNLVVGNVSGLVIYNARKINNRGQILAQGKKLNGAIEHNLLLTPI